MASGTTLALLASRSPATSFTWREHVTVQRASGKNCRAVVAATTRRAGCSTTRQVPKLPMRPTVLEAKDDVPKSTATAASATSTTLGDQLHLRRPVGDPDDRPGRRLPRRALDHRAGRARQHHFKVVTYLKMGCPLTTEQTRW